MNFEAFYMSLMYKASKFTAEPLQETAPGVGGVGLREVLGAVAHEAVPGFRIHDRVGMVGGDLRDVLGGDPHIVAAEEQQCVAVRRTQFVGNGAAVEPHGGIETL